MDDEPTWLPRARELRERKWSYQRIGQHLGEDRKRVYYWLNKNTRLGRSEKTCKGCGETFSPPDTRQVFCTRGCWHEHGFRPSLVPEIADKISAARTKTGKKTGLRQRQLEHAGFTLKAKGETSCRNCGINGNAGNGPLNLHHAIPRSMWKAGITEPLNGIPLCTTCHMGWHHRHVTIYRDVFRPDEWACVSSADLLGQNVEAWLDDRYPLRPLEVAA